MAFVSGTLEKNRLLKYQRIRWRRFVSMDDQESVENGVIDTKIVVTKLCNKKNKNSGKEREKMKGKKPSEREAREKCERMRKKIAICHKLPPPALVHSTRKFLLVL